MTTATFSEATTMNVEAARQLRRMAAAVRVSLRWWGTHRSLSAQQKEEVSSTYDADVRFLTAGKKIIDTKHEAFRKLTSLRTRLVNYWRSQSLPYTEPGIRLIRQDDIAPFVHCMEGFKEELIEAETNLNAAYDQMRGDARQRLGRLYDARDYPPEIRNLFDVQWDFPSVEPPNYLMRIAPDVYQREQERVAQRFEEAIRLAEQAFLAEFGKLVSHLAERLSGADGERRIFRDSAVTNLMEFFQRFRHLNLRSHADLDALVEQAQQLVQGVNAQQLRDNAALRQHVAAEMAAMQSSVEALLVEQPRRRIIRTGPARNGGSHDAGD